MADFNIRSDSVNVEQIMEQIRARIREKRGVDYTEEQIRELASVKLETFLNPHLVNFGLLKQFQERGTSEFENYEFGDSTLFESHRAPLRWIRRLFRPFLKLFVNLDRLIAVLHLQSRINTKQAQFGQAFELLHNLVLELTRLGIEVKNLKMRVESLSSRYDFAERRARALEGIVQARIEEQGDESPAPRQPRQPPQQRERGPQGQPQQAAAAPSQAQAGQGPAGAAAPGREGEAAGDARRRRRRRRGRRSGAGRPGGEDSAGPAQETGESDTEVGSTGPEDKGAGTPGTGARTEAAAETKTRPQGSDGQPSTGHEDQ